MNGRNNIFFSPEQVVCAPDMGQVKGTLHKYPRRRDNDREKKEKRWRRSCSSVSSYVTFLLSICWTWTSVRLRLISCWLPRHRRTLPKKKKTIPADDEWTALPFPCHHWKCLFIIIIEREREREKGGYSGRFPAQEPSIKGSRSNDERVAHQVAYI